MKMQRDVVILGGGPGGSSMAMFLVREGIKPLIVESEKFPRYHIGESMTGAAGKVMRDLGLEDEMMRRKYPVKKGVKVYGTTGNTTWFVPVTQRDENWKLQDSYTWQVRRSDFDDMMLKEALRRGADLFVGKATKPLLRDGAVRGIEVKTPEGKLVEIESELLVDASGQATFLANKGVTGPKYLGHYDKQTAFFSQVTDAVRGEGTTREDDPDNAIIFYNEKYHWSWFIPISENTVSVGVVAPAAYFHGKQETPRDFLTRELSELNPALPRYVPKVKLTEDMHVIPNWSYQVRRFTGKGYICIGDAHRFIDPIFSFGLTVTMREGQLAAPLVREYLEGKDRRDPRPFADYERRMEMGADVLEDTLDSFWEFPYGFAKYVHFDYKEQMTDMFAGRIYEHQPSEAILAIRKSLKRERTYTDDAYSIPYGSRFHPERAAIWEPNASVK
ncbi:MAG TPA: NAD(P)/FAD-dependent oxidoreductase, partial [Nitrososphaerales archaeon]|nr:NAD(P)/FAD-dependent oxidoreductase [Nitrososphaerales archaeon]